MIPNEQLNEIVQRTRTEAVRAYCQSCRPGRHPVSCDNTKCPLHPFRSAQEPPKSGSSRTRAVVKHCTECCCGSAKERIGCHIVDCELWAYRNGSPTLMPLISDERWQTISHILKTFLPENRKPIAALNSLKAKREGA